MSLSDPTVRANVLSEYVAFVDRKGGRAQVLLAAVGFTATDLADPQRSVSLNTVAELFEMAAVATNEPCFGLLYAEIFPPGGTGLLGQLMLSAPTVGDLLKVVTQYIEVHMMPMRPTLEASGDVYNLRLSYPPSFTAPQMQYTDFLIATLVRRLRLGAGETWKPVAVEFAHRAPADIESYARLLGRNMTFDARAYQVTIDAAAFARPMPKLLDGLFDSVRELGDRVLKETRLEQDLSHRIMATISRRIEEGERVGLDSIAQELGLPMRSVQWRLEQAGTTYERLLSLTRRRLAVRMLRDTDQSITEIAGRLGYSEASAFARAAQSWFGETPSAVRQRLRRAPQTS